MKKVLYLLLGGLLASSLISCNGEAEYEFAPSLDSNTSCDIRIVGSYDNFEALEAEFDRFNEFYPKVRLSYEKIDDYNNNLSTVLEGNDKPNIFFSYNWMLGNDKYNTVVSSMEDLSTSILKENLNCIRPGLISRDSEGKVLMVPVYSRTYGMLVNETLFEKEGLSIPNTLDELLTVCDSFKAKDYKSPMMGYTRKSSSCLMNTIAYPLFVADLAKNEEALTLANNLDPQAGTYMRKSLEVVKELVDKGCFDLTETDTISDNHESVIFRFFDGDVPMMVCTGDNVSGTKKREGLSEAFIKNPFKYSFSPIPLTNEGGYFIDSPSIEFSVNKNCNDLEMTNEFMKFLITNKELNEMAAVKRLGTPTKGMSFDSVYAPFGKIPQERIISPEALGIKDALTVQIRVASFKVAKGELTIDEAISMYGSFE